MKRYITVFNQFNGCHCYPMAPDEVSYLKNVHRHCFKVKTTISVTHNDRELEFYMVQDEIDLFIKDNFLSGSMSCEMYAEQLVYFILDKYGSDREVSVEVSEDGLQYATVNNSDEVGGT